MIKRGIAESVIAALDLAVDRVAAELERFDAWHETGDRPGQYRLDLAAEAAVADVFADSGFEWVSEESGAHRVDGAPCIVVDPVDGSTNASRRLPFYATSLAVVHDGELCAALVADHARGVRWSAGLGAARDRDARRTASVTADGPIVGINGRVPHLDEVPWTQFRALGCLSLELAAVADGTLDGYVSFDVDGHGPWDYLGGLLLVEQAGGTVVDAEGRDLVTTDPTARRTIVAARDGDLLDSLVGIAPRSGRVRSTSGDPR